MLQIENPYYLNNCLWILQLELSINYKYAYLHPLEFLYITLIILIAVSRHVNRISMELPILYYYGLYVENSNLWCINAPKYWQRLKLLLLDKIEPWNQTLFQK